MTNPSNELQTELGAHVDALALLTTEESAALLVMFQRARTSQRDALDASMAELLAHLPRLMRVPARKILFG